MKNLLIKGCKSHDHKVPDKENNTKFSVHLPAIGVGGQDEKHHGGEQGESGVEDTWEDKGYKWRI